MKFGPCFHQSSLSPWQGTFNKFDRVHAIDSNVVLIVRMKMRRVMRRPDFPKHADDDAEEAAQFWHEGILTSPQCEAQWNLLPC